MMLRRVLAIIMLTLSVAAFGIMDASAQPVLNDHRLMVSEHTGLRGIGALFDRTFHPVLIWSAEVPDTLAVGEERLFAVRANVEHSSLPLRARWEFSDGTVAHGLSVRHAFQSKGRYKVHVHVENGGSEAAKSFEVTVVPSANRNRM